MKNGSTSLLLGPNLSYVLNIFFKFFIYFLKLNISRPIYCTLVVEIH